MDSFQIVRCSLSPPKLWLNQTVLYILLAGAITQEFLARSAVRFVIKMSPLRL